MQKLATSLRQEEARALPSANRCDTAQCRPANGLPLAASARWGSATWSPPPWPRWRADAEPGTVRYGHRPPAVIQYGDDTAQTRLAHWCGQPFTGNTRDMMYVSTRGRKRCLPGSASSACKCSTNLRPLPCPAIPSCSGGSACPDVAPPIQHAKDGHRVSFMIVDYDVRVDDFDAGVGARAGRGGPLPGDCAMAR